MEKFKALNHHVLWRKHNQITCFISRLLIQDEEHRFPNVSITRPNCTVNAFSWNLQYNLVVALAAKLNCTEVKVFFIFCLNPIGPFSRTSDSFQNPVRTTALASSPIPHTLNLTLYYRVGVDSGCLDGVKHTSHMTL